MEWNSSYLTSKFLAIFLSFAVIYTPKSKGEVLFEPLASFKIAGSTEHQNEDFETRQFEFGGRGGFYMTRSFVGLDLTLSNMSIKSPSGTTEESYTGVHWGLTAGHTFNIIRVFGTFYPSNTLVSDFDQSKLKGSGLALGASIGGNNRVNLFVLFQSRHYKTRETTDGQVTNLDGSLSINPQLFLLGISLPFVF